MPHHKARGIDSRPSGKRKIHDFPGPNTSNATFWGCLTTQLDNRRRKTDPARMMITDPHNMMMDRTLLLAGS